MMNKKIIGVVAVVVIIVAVMQLRGGSSEKWNGIQDEPSNVAIDFYTNWVERGEGDINELLKDAPLAEDVKQMLKDNISAEVDPVACRAFDEVQIRTRAVFEREDTAQYIMQVAKGELTDGYAVVDLSGRNGEWQIESITCAYGDVAPERGEFNFDQEGGLLKNVPAPYDTNFWHLIFERDGQIGVVPLRFTDDTQCITAEGDTVSCDDGYLIEAMDAHVYGHMSEEGAEVARVEAK